MRSVKYSASLAVKLTPGCRQAIEELAGSERISLGEAARKLIDMGIEASARRPTA